MVERIVAGDIPDIKPPVKKKLATFVSIIDDLRKYANQVRISRHLCHDRSTTTFAV